MHAAIEAHRRGGGLGEAPRWLICMTPDDPQRIIADAVSDLALERRPARCFTGDLPLEGSGTRDLISMSDLAGGVSG